MRNRIGKNELQEYRGGGGGQVFNVDILRQGE